jgi:transcriptional regulator with XRE-family HTH domain
MPRPARHLFPDSARQAQALGERLRLARLRRRIPQTEMAARVGVSRMTIGRLERGDAAVALAILTRVLEVLGLEGDLDALARDDALGTRLQDESLPGPRRVLRRPVADEL